MLKDYVRFAIEGVLHRRLRSWLTMIGIFIGIAAVVSLIGLGEGLRSAITGQFGFISPDLISVQASGVSFGGPPGSGAANPLDEDLSEHIERINGVHTVINRYIESGALIFNDQQEITFAWNVPDGEKRKVAEDLFNIEVSSGRLLKDGDGLSALIGSSLADGDQFGKRVKVGNTVSFSGKDVKIVGILEPKGSFIFDSALIMNEETIVDEFREDDTVDVIAVKVQDVDDIPQVKERIEQVLRQERDVKEGEEDFSVESAQSSLDQLNSTLFAVQLFVIIIAMISILVGGIGIANTMYTAVLERTKQIGIMKSIGAKNSTIFTIFFVESGFLGFLGGLIGVILGVTLAYGMAFAGQQALGSDLIEAHVSPFLIIGALLFSFIVGLLAGVIPAVQASKKHPVDALRFAK